MDEEKIRAPDDIKREKLLSNDESYFPNNNEHVFMNQIQDKQLQKALALSIKEFEKEEQLKRQKIIEKQQEEKRIQEEIERREKLTNEFLKRACVLRLSNDQNSLDTINYFQEELEKYKECKISKIILFSKHKDVIDHFLEDMYNNPLKNNKVPRFSEEVYNYISNSYELF